MANPSPSISELRSTNNLDLDVSEITLRSTLDDLIHFLIPSSRLTIMDSSEIGCGRYGEVLLATLDGSSQTPILVAVKELRAVGTRGVRKRMALRLARELKIWAKANHPHVLQLVGYYLSDNYEIAQLISPFMTNGNVSQYLEKLEVGVHKRLDIIQDITLGMNYLHSCDPPICHGDLKPTNVLMNDSLQAVLCDFGLASFVEESCISTGLTTSRSIKGSIRYMSPELHLEEDAKHTLESDIWAWGCTAFEIVTDCAPYHALKGDSGILMAFMRKDPPGSTETLMGRLAHESSASAHPAFQSLPDCLTKCWDFETRQRPQMASILRQVLGNRSMEETREVEDIAIESLSPLSLDHATSASPETLPSLRYSCPVAPVDCSPRQKAPLTPLFGRFESTSSLPQLPRKLDSEGGGLVQHSVVLPGGIWVSNFWSRIRVHIGNLPYQAGRQDLEVLFRSAGTVVSASVNRVNVHGKSTGTVVFESPEDAERAIRMFNGYSWSGQILEVQGDCGAESRLDMGSTRRNMGTASASRTNRSRPLPLPRGNINQLYVGNLPYQVTWQVLTELFRSAGSVLRAEINISPSGRVQGSGTVVFASARDAQIAIQMFDGYEWYGRRLEVRELQGANIQSTAPISAAAVVSTSGGRHEDGRDFSGDISISHQSRHIATPSRQITIRNLPWTTASEDLIEIFETIGNVEFAEILLDGIQSKCAGVVQFTQTEEAEAAIARLQRYMYDGRALDIAFSDRWHLFTPGAAKGGSVALMM